MITYNTRMFFTSAEVIAKTNAAERRVLSRFGAFVRTRDISSQLGHAVRSFGVKSKVRSREGVSRPGQPPFPHVGTLVKGVEFAFDQDNHSVVIGVAKIHSKIGDAPHALEHGGPSVIMTKIGESRVARTATIAARPHTTPAFQKELDRMPEMWRDQIR